MPTAGSQFHRHKTAISRPSLSRPMRLVLESRLIDASMSVFDYGCGLGGDVAQLASLGFRATGWDPMHRPETQRSPTDVVNLGYVVNVIEDPEERSEVLRSAWRLAEKVLVVSARLHAETNTDRFEACGDGCVTGRGTFQKLYRQLELRDWIDGVVGERSLPLAPGVFVVFRDAGMRQTFIERRYRRTRAAPRPRVSDVLFERHGTLLSPLIDFVTDRGRLPAGEEQVAFQEVEAQFGSLKRAFSVIRRATGAERWEEIRRERLDELHIHFALDRFGGRPRFSELSPAMQADVKEFFSTYTNACAEGDRWLFRAGQIVELERAMRQSTVGKLTGNALYVHADALPQLPTLLRIYEGCARAYLGHVEGANLLKLHREEPKVSYLFYPDFNDDPHPALRESLRLKLSNVDVKYTNFSDSENPPVLHRKEEFLAADDPRHERFARLTRQEERFGLYEDTTVIGTRSGWTDALQAKGVRLRGHRVVRVRRPATGGDGTPVMPAPSPDMGA